MNEIVANSRKRYLRAREYYEGLRQTYKNAQKAFESAKRPDWIEFLVQPIADYIQEAIPGSVVEVSGPLGLGARAYIWVDLEKDGTIYTSGVALDPPDPDNAELKMVDYSTIAYDYPPNSLGARNSLQYALVDLPDLDELVQHIQSSFSPKYHQIIRG